MARLQVTYNNGAADWTITGLQSSFNKEFYNSAGITTFYFNDGDTRITSVDRVFAPATGSSKSVSGRYFYNVPGSYEIWGFAEDASQGRFWKTDNSVTIKIGPPRPQNWYWSNMRSGCNPPTAYEWNNFTDRINAFRDYMGLPRYNFTFVNSGTPFYAGFFNVAVDAIAAMTYLGVSRKSAGETIFADYFNIMANALNSIK